MPEPQIYCNPSKCDFMNCHDTGDTLRCKRCRTQRPTCEFDEEIADRVCDGCRVKMIEKAQKNRYRAESNAAPKPSDDSPNDQSGGTNNV